MTITYVGVSSPVATGNNASVVPALPSGLAVNDLMILVASIRNSGTGTVNDVTGWFRITGSNNVAVFGRLYQSGDAAPTVSFANGVANADTLAQIVAFRDTERAIGTIYATGQLNTSAQDILYPALNVTGPGQAVLIVGWKQDDATGYGTPAGFTGAGIASSTTGDDASQTVRYSIQTAETDIAAGTLTVTGGAAAISRAIVLAIRQRATLTADQQDSWPPRVLVTLAGIAAGDAVTIYRVVDNQRIAVRAGVGTATDSAFLVVDAEIPFGVPVHYEADVNGQVSYSTSDVTYTLPGGKNAITDAVSGLAAEVTIQTWPSVKRERRSSVFRTRDGRNVVVSGALGQFTSSLVLYTDSAAAAANLETVLEDATEGVVQIRQGSGALDIDAYVSVLSIERERFDEFDGLDARRLWRLDVAETESWAPALAAQGYTYGDMQTSYAGLTYAQLAADYPTYLALRQGEFT
jgi:hypothetical protein